MIVKMRESGRSVTSLQIGAQNVRRYFSRNVPTVDLDLDSLQIQCHLGDEFWRDHPEIIDPRLIAWLTSKKSKLRDGDRVILHMLPSGRNAFRLKSEPAPAASRRNDPDDSTA